MRVQRNTFFLIYTNILVKKVPFSAQTPLNCALFSPFFSFLLAIQDKIVTFVEYLIKHIQTV